MSLAARGGDPEARTNLVQMTARNGADKKAADITGHPVNPGRDAVAKRRDPDFIESYLLENIKDIYPEFQSERVIMSAQSLENARSITGSKLWGLSVKYQCLAARRAVGLKGSLLMGIEFQDPVTGESYWAFNESKDPDTAFTGGAFADVSMFVDLSRYPNLRVRNWAIAYGHRLDEDQILVVLAEKERSFSAGTLDQMISRNRFSGELASTIVATVDITGTAQSSSIAAEGNNSTRTKESDNILFNSDARLPVNSGL
jgi:hypothetical protein